MQPNSTSCIAPEGETRFIPKTLVRLKPCLSDSALTALDSMPEDFFMKNQTRKDRHDSSSPSQY